MFIVASPKVVVCPEKCHIMRSAVCSVTIRLKPGDADEATDEVDSESMGAT
mgnify:CR=1 FL=1